MSHMYLRPGVSVSFEDGQPTSITWQIGSMGEMSSEECREEAQKRLQMCGFKVLVSKIRPGYDAGEDWPYEYYAHITQEV